MGSGNGIGAFSLYSYEARADQKFCKGLYGDFTDRYLGHKNRNKSPSEFLTLPLFLIYGMFMFMASLDLPLPSHCYRGE